MLRQLYTRARPSLLRPIAHHRQFRSRPQLSFSNYAPPPPGPYFSAPPRSRGSRLKDIALGSVITIVAYIAYQFYSFRQFSKDLEKAVEELSQEEARDDELRLSFADARRAGDHDRLREITFQHARRKCMSDHTMEFGPLPSFFGDKNIIPEEDTLVFIGVGNEAVINVFGHSILEIDIAINAELNEEFLPSRNPKEGAALTELLARINSLTVQLARKGLLDEVSGLALRVFLRDQYFQMEYDINLPTPEDETENETENAA
ncbi:hypothetical protein F5Y00DRAFT_163971 [Daldinia vernicosa]|uniref:uncharacterized protein n=1 Tax=Daldinia vernicosa TaxID=114800 RepID=UPI0020088FEE|nr:uncharacterized protein F5Y00DRAFT_163971 [Daldinia vernicosa]KAI0845684.1 hypothetical protein F5Y00DRAFT_163971 [Daldinia vernicosa]